MLGALALGDIGKHFPDTDMKYKGIDSKILLKECYELIKRKGYQLVNIDSTLLLQAPKIKPYVEQMQIAIAGIVGLTIDEVSIKATTTEHLSFIGREEGVVATANVLLQKNVATPVDVPLATSEAEPTPASVIPEKIASNEEMVQQN
jgi:2-C-methyl-D-erythritol 2,4-cyclodiphosphate synthase